MLTVVVVPETVKSPDTVRSLKVTSEVVATACPIDIAPPEYVTPVLPDKYESISVSTLRVSEIKVSRTFCKIICCLSC